MAIVKLTGGAKEAGLAAGISQALGYELQEKKAKEMAEFESNLKMDYEKRKAALQYEIDLATEARAHAWDIKRMEASADIDFQYKERRRQQQISFIDNDIDGIDKYMKDNNITEENSEYWSLMNRKEKLERDRADILAGRTLKAEQPSYLSPEEQREAALRKVGLEQEEKSTFYEKAKAAEIISEIEEKEPGWFKQTFLPESWQGGPTETDEAMKQEAMKILGLEPKVLETTAPKTEEDFRNTVSQLKIIDPAKARIYYNQYGSLFGYDVDGLTSVVEQEKQSVSTLAERLAPSPFSAPAPIATPVKKPLSSKVDWDYVLNKGFK